MSREGDGVVAEEIDPAAERTADGLAAVAPIAPVVIDRALEQRRDCQGVYRGWICCRCGTWCGLLRGLCRACSHERCDRR